MQQAVVNELQSSGQLAKIKVCVVANVSFVGGHF